MISNNARYYGSFFTLLLDNLSEPVSLRKLETRGGGLYLINEVTPIALKMSSKRLGPWTFNFLRSHQKVYDDLFRHYSDFYVCLICGRDGIAGLSMQELRLVLDENYEEQEIVSVRRRLKKMYQVTGKDGTLEKRISRLSIFEKIQHSIARENLK